MADYPNPLTEDYLVRLMQDPRYWNASHPDYNRIRDHVMEGFRRL